MGTGSRHLQGTAPFIASQKYARSVPTVTSINELITFARATTDQLKQKTVYAYELISP